MRNGEPGLPNVLCHTDVVWSIAISSDGRIIASGLGRRAPSICLWDTKTGTAVGEPLYGHRDGVTAVEFSPNVKWLASGSEDDTVRIWDVRTRRVSAIYPLICDGMSSGIAFSLDGLFLVAGDGAGRIHLWHAGTGGVVCEPLRVVAKADDSCIDSIRFSPDGLSIACQTGDGCIRIWDFAKRQQVLLIESQPDSELSGSLAYSPDDRLIGCGSIDGIVCLWDAATGAPSATLSGHGGMVSDVTFTPDGQYIVSCSDDETIRVWDVEQACASSSRSDNDIIMALAPTGLNSDGWLLGQSGELLLWVPPEYRAYLHVPPCTMVIGKRRIVITTDDRRLYHGEDWTACWNR